MKSKMVKVIRSPLLWFAVVLASYVSLLILRKLEFRTIIFPYESVPFDSVLSLLSGFLVSFIFFFLVVHIPEKRKRNIVKKNFAKLYKEIKEDMLREILWYSKEGGRTDIEITEELVERL